MEINIFSLVKSLLSDENKADFTHEEQITDGKQGTMFLIDHLRRDTRKPTMWFPTRSDTNLAVQSQKMDRGWKVWI